MVHDGIIPNFHVTLGDINNSNTIFGPDFSSLKGKMVRLQPKPLVSNYINTPKDILQLHKMVSVEAEIMFVNRMAFLVSISRHVKFTTVLYLGKRTMSNIFKYLEKINDVYYRCGVYVEKLYMDRDFENTIRIMPGK